MKIKRIEPIVQCIESSIGEYLDRSDVHYELRRIREQLFFETEEPRERIARAIRMIDEALLS